MDNMDNLDLYGTFPEFKENEFGNAALQSILMHLLVVRMSD